MMSGEFLDKFVIEDKREEAKKELDFLCIDQYDKGYDGGYKEGHQEGYDEGYVEGEENKD